MRQWLQRLSIPDKTRLALQPLKNQLKFCSNLMFIIYKYILVACLRLFCRGTNMEHVLDRNR